MPGLLFVILTLLWLFIVEPQFLYKLLPYIQKESALGAALGSLLVSGGLGYIFATIHHACHCFFNKKCKEEKDRILDHRSIAKEITMKEYSDPELAMALSYAHWYNQLRAGNIGDAADKKVGSLGDQSHGLGAARVASFFALATTLLILYNKNYFAGEPCLCEPAIRFIGMLVLGGWITCLFHLGYKRVGTIAHATYENILKDARHRKSGKPL